MRPKEKLTPEEPLDEAAKRRIALEGLKALNLEMEAYGRERRGSDLSVVNLPVGREAELWRDIKSKLGVNYVGPEVLGRELYKDENKWRVPPLDLVKLTQILEESDEWEPGKKKSETYALVYKPPISFLELRERANEAASEKGKTAVFFSKEGGNWYNDESFVKEAPKEGSWELVRKETVRESIKKNYQAQLELIKDKSDLSPATFQGLAAMLVGQYLANGIRIYNGNWHYGRTSTTAASGAPVGLGSVDAHGAGVGAHGVALDDVGLALSRNL